MRERIHMRRHMRRAHSEREWGRIGAAADIGKGALDRETEEGQEEE